jgi:hypothetical protein
MSEQSHTEQSRTENRSSALSPEQLGAMNAMVAAAVKEAMVGMAAVFAPMVQQMAITPEKLREANRPYVDPKKKLREDRETKLWREDIDDARRTTQMSKDNCIHQDDNQRTSIRLIRNFPDRQVRGVCVKCQDIIHPKEWRIGAPDEQNPRGVAYTVAPHKDYLIVRQLMSRE